MAGGIGKGKAVGDISGDWFLQIDVEARFQCAGGEGNVKGNSDGEGQNVHLGAEFEKGFKIGQEADAFLFELCGIGFIEMAGVGNGHREPDGEARIEQFEKPMDVDSGKAVDADDAEREGFHNERGYSESGFRLQGEQFSHGRLMEV